MPPSISAAAAYRTYSCPAMSSLSSSLAPKRQLRLTAATTVLILFFLVLFVSPSEARRLRAHGKSSLSKSPPVPCKDAANPKVDGSPTKQTKDLSNVDAHTTAMDDHMVRVDAKVKEGVAMASSPGAIRTTIVVTVSQQLSHPEQGEATGFHLDYAGPKTHPPSHN